MKKKLLSGLLALCLVFGSASALPSGVFDESTSITASAEVETNDQNYSDYEFKDNGDGTATLVKYVGLDEHVAVPAITSDGKEVTSIGKNAFAEDYYLTEVTIPNTVTNIEEEAFAISPILKINLPSSIKTIGKRAFYQSQLRSVTIPESVTSIGDEAFADCSFLKDVTILGSVENFGDNVFWWSGVSQVSFGDNVKCIGKEAFSKCGFLKNITIPGNIKSIDERAFYYSGLENVIIEQGVETIAKGAFEDCLNLNSLSIAKSINHFGADAFKNTPWLKAQKDLTPFVIVNKILIAANGKECTGDVNIPDGVIAIGGKAFVECYYMTSVKIPNSVTSIGEGAFEGCFITDKSARSLDIPKSVTDIGDNAFASCGLKSIVIPSSVNRIGKKAFYYSWLESLTIRNGVETIDDEAFWGCSKLNRVSIPSSVRTIGERAFANTGLTSITIPKTVTLIGKRAFGYDYNDVRISDFKIYAYKGSAGEEYAKKFLLVVNYITDDPTRFKGSGRYATAAAISQGAYPDKADTVVLANGTKFADALAGATLANAYEAPILLTEAGRLPDETLAEIKRLKAKNVIILGGSASVGQAVKDTLDKNGLKYSIVKGKSKYATAVEIAKATKTVTVKDPSEIFFVSADKFADALSVSAVAAKKNAPIIYLPKTGSLDVDTAAYLKSVKGKIKNAYVIGGSGVIGADVMAAAGKALGLTVDKNIVRVKGKTKYDTCVEVNTKFADVLNGKAICVATGEDFPDALAGGVFAAKNTAPLFLASGSLSENQKSYLKTKKAENIFVFGGSKSVPNDLVQSIATASL